MEKRVSEKKGISPVIATVLLILLTIALFVIIFWWASRFIQEEISKFDAPISSSCESVDLAVSYRSNDGLSIVNRGNIDIYDLEIRIDQGGGNIESSRLRDKFSGEFPIGAGESVSFDDYTIHSGEKLTVYPVLLGVGSGNKNKAYTCIDRGFNVK